MFPLNRPLSFVGALLIASCAQPPLEVGANHPANPDATAAPASPPSTTLVIAQESSPAAPGGRANRNAASPAPGGAHQHGSQAPTATQAMYMCPMHPDVTSTDPDAKCPKCGMKINKPVQRATTSPAEPGQKSTDHSQHEGH